MADPLCSLASLTIAPDYRHNFANTQWKCIVPQITNVIASATKSYHDTVLFIHTFFWLLYNVSYIQLLHAFWHASIYYTLTSLQVTQWHRHSNCPHVLLYSCFASYLIHALLYLCFRCYNKDWDACFRLCASSIVVKNITALQDTDVPHLADASGVHGGECVCVFVCVCVCVCASEKEPKGGYVVTWEIAILL